MLHASQAVHGAPLILLPDLDSHMSSTGTKRLATSRFTTLLECSAVTQHILPLAVAPGSAVTSKKLACTAEYALHMIRDCSFMLIEHF